MFGFVKYLFKLQFLFILAAVLAGLYRTEIKQFANRHAANYVDKADGETVSLQFKAANENTATVLTSAELSKYNGEDGQPIYLALLGSVFDVTRGIKHYGTGCSYNFFVGRDASVAFISGEFEEYDPQTADDVLTLKPNDLLGLANWRDFYEKEYIYKGKLIGRFYDEQGEPTTYYHKYLALLEQAQIAKAEVDELRSKYPGCNIEWSEAKGTRVWCTNTSGDGKERAWTGFPRKLYSRGNKNFNCACVPESELDQIDAEGQAAHGDAMFKTYDNCSSRAKECFYRV
ncbi:neuferricin homolog [Drosophila persimilis]|uniref:neuferricin homolog n=1 Tax=Drosophila persimilis TaxID=7234 RepID=UPI000F0842DA|nr:neuferricin homolog [Drosophila persimilis]